MSKTVSRIQKLLPDEERAVDDLLAELFSGGKGRKITSVQKLVETICRRQRDLGGDAVIQYLGILIRRGELRMNESRKAPSFEFVPPGGTVLDSIPPDTTSFSFAHLSGKKERLNGKWRNEFDRLLCAEIGRQEKVFLSDLTCELPGKYPALQDAHKKTVFTRKRVWSAIKRLAQEGAIATERKGKRMLLTLARAGSKQVGGEGDTSVSRVSKMPAVSLAQLRHHGHITGQLREEFDRLLLMDLERRGDDVLLYPWVLELPRRYPKLCNTAGATVFSYTRVYGTILRLAERGAVTMKKENGKWRVRAVKKVTGADALSTLHDRSALAPTGVPADKLAELKDMEARRDQIMEELAKLVQRIESLRFDLYCRAIVVVSRGSPK